MGKLSDEIMGKLDAKKGGGGGGGNVSDGDPEDAKDGGADEATEDSYGNDEEKAMADFEDATTPAEKAAAMKAFLEICVPKIVKGM